MKPIPGVRYRVMKREPHRFVIKDALYIPTRKTAEYHWLDLSSDAPTWLLWGPSEIEILEELYNPHGEPKVSTLWGVKPDWYDGDEEDIVYGEGMGFSHFSLYSEKDARDHATELGGTVVTRTITTTTITDKTEWEEVTDA
jgi:hypothetical protein